MGGVWEKGGLNRTETTTPVSRLFARSYHECRMKPFRLPGDGRTLAQGTQQGNFGGISSSFSWRKKIAFLLEINYLKCIFIFTGKSGTLPRKWAQSKQRDIAKNIILIMSFRYYLESSRCL